MTNYWLKLYFSFKCQRCVNDVQVKLPPPDSDCTSDLAQWYHCSTKEFINNKGTGIPDTVLSQAWNVDAKGISFVFHHRSSQAEIKLEDATEKVGQKKKKTFNKYDDDDDENDIDYGPEDDDKDEDFVV